MEAIDIVIPNVNKLHTTIEAGHVTVLKNEKGWCKNEKFVKCI